MDSPVLLSCSELARGPEQSCVMLYEVKSTPNTVSKCVLKRWQSSRLRRGDNISQVSHLYVLVAVILMSRNAADAATTTATALLLLDGVFDLGDDLLLLMSRAAGTAATAAAAAASAASAGSSG